MHTSAVEVSTWNVPRDSLNAIGPHKLIESRTIRKCSFVGVDVTLMKAVFYCGGEL